ncbi:hypothetical protein [Cellulomonas biazotea]|uniref:Uncharacterized protein n=1 Tax=Cellulomonas biazotea TaxID=1709 RepID=A0A402DVI5_9CELL|nr:hypothetical protein [Cellulomonas biazotea]GCE78115.1 hypothetical protein CBZ_31710 [Cellulomonas biazotea]
MSTEHTSGRRVEEQAHHEERARRRKAVVAWGAVAGVVVLATTAAFTDVARLNLGTEGLGGVDATYDLQVAGTDVDGRVVPGTWQQADAAEGVPLFVEGAQSMFPGSAPVTVEVPVRNASPVLDSSLGLTLATLADDEAAGRVTDATYLGQLRFDVDMPATSMSAAPVTHDGLTAAELVALPLNDLAAGEESVVVVTISLLSLEDGSNPGADNVLSGKGAALQAQLHGSSVS